MSNETTIISLLEKAYDEGYDTGYQEGHGDALKNLGQNTDIISIPELQIEPEPVHKFLTEVTYSDDVPYEKITSKIDDYLDGVDEGSHQSWTEKTNPFVVEGDGETLELERVNEDVAYYQSATGRFEVYNLLPDKTYLWSILKDGKPTKTGLFYTVGSTRMIGFDAEGEKTPVNVRDIGMSGKIKYGKIIRGAYIPSELTKDSAAIVELLDMGITTELDLTGDGFRDDLGWKGYSCDVNAYEDMLSKPTDVAKCFEIMTDTLESGGSVYMHCFAGADRTGTLTAVIQLLLGVGFDPVVKEYELTSFCCWCNRMRFHKKMYVFFKALSAYPGSNYQEKVRYWLINKAKVQESLLDRFCAQLAEG